MATQSRPFSGEISLNDLERQKLAEAFANDLLAKLKIQSDNKPSDGQFVELTQQIHFVCDQATGQPSSTAGPEIRLTCKVPLGLMKRQIFLRVARVTDPAQIFPKGVNNGVLRFFKRDGLIGELPVDTTGQQFPVRLVGTAPGDYASNISVAFCYANDNAYSGNAASGSTLRARPVLLVNIQNSTAGSGGVVEVPAGLELLLDCDRIEYLNSRFGTAGTNTGAEILLFFLGVMSAPLV